MRKRKHNLQPYDDSCGNKRELNKRERRLGRIIIARSLNDYDEPEPYWCAGEGGYTYTEDLSRRLMEEVKPVIRFYDLNGKRIQVGRRPYV